MDFETKISKVDSQDSLVRGYELLDIAKNLNFTQTIFLVLKGELPNKQEEDMLNKILAICVDHGVEVSSAVIARTTLSAGNKFNSSVAAGINTLGDNHGGAIENCVNFLEKYEKDETIVLEYIESRKKIPGFGHKIYKESDPRTQLLLDSAKENKIFSKNCKDLVEIENKIEQVKGKKLCLNVDGAIAGIISDMGFKKELANAFFIISRTVGLCAHVGEEKEQRNVVRREEKSTYSGPEKRTL